jgi:hypothetical protein
MENETYTAMSDATPEVYYMAEDFAYKNASKEKTISFWVGATSLWIIFWIGFALGKFV